MSDAEIIVGKVTAVVGQGSGEPYASPIPTVNAEKKDLSWLYTQKLFANGKSGRSFGMSLRNTYKIPAGTVPKWLVDNLESKDGAAVRLKYGWLKKSNITLPQWASWIAVAPPADRVAMVDLHRILLANRSQELYQQLYGEAADAAERSSVELTAVQRATGGEPPEPDPWYTLKDPFGLPAWVAPAVIGLALLFLGGPP